jgi:hypothetical protein
LISHCCLWLLAGCGVYFCLSEIFYYRTEANLARQGSTGYETSDNFAGELLYRLAGVTKVCLIYTRWIDLDEFYLKQVTFDKF